MIDSAGRVEKFMRKYGMAEKTGKDKSKAKAEGPQETSKEAAKADS